MRNALMAMFLALVLQTASGDAWWSVQTSGMDTNLRGVSAARASGVGKMPVVWASGSKGVILRSSDDGKTWERLRVGGGETLDFRGIQAMDEKTAYAMSIGPGEQSRIYKTADGGANWELQYSDKRAAFFLDALVCTSATQCFALSDPVDGKFLLMGTTDGKRWSELPREGMPEAMAGEGAFAASNSGLTIYGGNEIYFGTGGGTSARVFHSTDLGHTWTTTETPIAAGNASSGIFSIARAGNTVIAVGGDYKQVDASAGVAAYSRDGGKTWKLAEQQPGGFRSAVAHLDGAVFIAAGTNGEDFSTDGGAHWARTDALNINALAVLDKENAWAAGAKGTIARMRHRDAGSAEN
jgi:photosystem II stability/assembly factor-like uncharacterized protein